MPSEEIEPPFDSHNTDRWSADWAERQADAARRRIQPPFVCRCNWCGREFIESQMITNTCPDCRHQAHRAYDEVLADIRRKRLLRESGNE